MKFPVGKMPLYLIEPNVNVVQIYQNYLTVTGLNWTHTAILMIIAHNTIRFFAPENVCLQD